MQTLEADKHQAASAAEAALAAAEARLKAAKAEAAEAAGEGTLPLHCHVCTMPEPLSGPIVPTKPCIYNGNFWQHPHLSVSCQCWWTCCAYCRVALLCVRAENATAAQASLERKVARLKEDHEAQFKALNEVSSCSRAGGYAASIRGADGDAHTQLGVLTDNHHSHA